MNQIPNWWHDAQILITKRDPIMGQLIAKYQNLAMQRQSSAFTVLIKAIIGQQISTKAASSIFQKLKTKVTLEPQAIYEQQHIILEAGMANSKKQYILNIVDWFVQNNADDQYCLNTPEDELKEQLLQIKGIGPWTWHMFQMFYLLSPNVLPLGDLGVIKGFQTLYQPKNDNIKEAIERHANKYWQPYCSLPVWLLWRYLDGVEVNY